jgi:polysaccharide export outer membrane protein
MDAALPYNVDPLNMNTNNLGNGSSRPLLGYLVDRDGYIDFPVLGRLKVGGLTTGEVREMLVSKLQPEYLKDPVVIVRFLNFRVTVLGEVGNPGTFPVSTERLTLMDALGLAGDLQPYADRTNVMITREQNGFRTYGTLNLQDRNIFQSQFYYLQQNDLIYVQPLQERTAALRDQSQRVLPYISAGVTLVTLVITLTNLNR